MNGTPRPPLARSATPVSVEDVARVVTRALSERSARIRLTAGQRRAILHPGGHPGRAAS